MSEALYITSFCHIESGKVILNGETIYAGEDRDMNGFMKAVYKHSDMNYPKFYKMDSLCKLAFIASELLLRANPLTERYNNDSIAIVISNSASSLETDTEHQSTISDPLNFFPSPAVFVYTLPNILIGEIAIRNNIKGENSLFIFENFNTGFMADYIDLLFVRPATESCIAGYVDFYEDNYKAFLYTVEKVPGKMKTEHKSQNLNQLYNNKS